MQYIAYGVIGLVVLLALFAIITAVVLRRVVPTNMVHIVQSSKKTTSYGKGKETGNTYYAFPTWVPVIGVSVTQFPESIFQLPLQDYEAYDQTRLPFMVDVVAFFRVEDSTTAAQRVASFAELQVQLDSVLKGVVRRILATNTLEHIMEARSEFGEQFTQEVSAQIKEWGVTTTKMIEFMDIRDSRNGKVIHDMMAREQSRIDMVSRQTVAENQRSAQIAEIDAQRQVAVQQQDAAQQVGLRTAEKDKIVGIAREQASQEVQEQAAVTKTKAMQVVSVEQNRTAEIERDVLLTTADARAKATVLSATANAEAVALQSTGDLKKTLNDAEGVAAAGKARAAAEEAFLLAPVTAQITLAKEIGENNGYQEYMIKIRQVDASQQVGVEMAGAIKAAEIKIISTGGDSNIASGVAGIADMFTPVGGAKMTGMLAALAQTPEGAAVVDGLAKRLAGN